MHEIAEICLCVPEYVPDVREILNDTRLKGCNFYEHSTCVNYVHYYFDPSTAHCKPACQGTKYEQARIQAGFGKVEKMIQSNYKKLYSVRSGP